MPRDKRKLANQALFREVNERIADLAALLDDNQEMQAFVCECSRIGCTDTIEVPIATYARIRDDPQLFLLVGGHEDADGEEVVEDLGSYLIVRANHSVD